MESFEPGDHVTVEHPLADLHGPGVVVEVRDYRTEYVQRGYGHVVVRRWVVVDLDHHGRRVVPAGCLTPQSVAA